MRRSAVGLLSAALLAGCSSGGSAPPATTQQPPPSNPAPAPRPERRAQPKPVVAVAPLPATVARQLRAHHFWHTGCPVSQSGLRVLTVPYWGFDRQIHAGQ